MMEKEIIKLAKDITCCEECPLKSECKGMTSDGSGRPIEPVCTSWGPDDEISIEDYYHQQELRCNEYEEQERKEEGLKEKRELKNKRAELSRIHVHYETHKIKNLKKRISANLELASVATVFSVTNEMLRIKDERPKKAKSIIELENEKLYEQITEIEKIKKQKLKEFKERQKETIVKEDE